MLSHWSTSCRWLATVCIIARRGARQLVEVHGGRAVHRASAHEDIRAGAALVARARARASPVAHASRLGRLANGWQGRREPARAIGAARVIVGWRHRHAPAGATRELVPSCRIQVGGGVHGIRRVVVTVASASVGDQSPRVCELHHCIHMWAARVAHQGARLW